MWRELMKSKVHRATVTQADLDYVGSCTLDAALMDAADLLPGEKVDIGDITNGNRLVTSLIEAPRGGPTAHPGVKPPAGAPRRGLVEDDRDDREHHCRRDHGHHGHHRRPDHS